MRDYNRSLGRMASCWKEDPDEFALHCSQPSHKFQHITCRVGALAMALIGNAKQPMGEGKSGPVETGLAKPAAYGPAKGLLRVLNYTFGTFKSIQRFSILGL